MRRGWRVSGPWPCMELTHLLHILCAHWLDVPIGPWSFPRPSPGGLCLGMWWSPFSGSAVCCLQFRWPCQKS